MIVEVSGCKAGTEPSEQDMLRLERRDGRGSRWKARDDFPQVANSQTGTGLGILFKLSKPRIPRLQTAQGWQTAAGSREVWIVRMRFWSLQLGALRASATVFLQNS